MPKIQPSHPSHDPSSSSRHRADRPKEDEVLALDPHVDNGKDKKGAGGSIVVSNMGLEGQVKELSGQVKGLSAKIAELTALIMAQQGTVTPPEEEDEDEAA